MELCRSKIKDVERLKRYELIIKEMLKKSHFSKHEILSCGESKWLIGRIINTLLSQRAIIKEGRRYKWRNIEKERYKKEWQDSPASFHQIKRFSREQRPREKLLKYGWGKLTPVELLAIFLRTGIKGKSALHLASDLLERFGGVRGIFEAKNRDLLKVEGLGEAKVAQIKAVYGLAQQYLKEKIKAGEIIKSSRDVYDYLYFTMRDLKKEIFKVIFLDGKNQIIAIEDLFKGTLNQSSVYPREIIKSAIKYNAAGVIFVHNHPSGNPEPSLSDKEITKDLVFAGNLMQIKVLDHIIIGENRYFSFADEGLIEEYNLKYTSMKRDDKT
ncbi:RadC-like JAB domain protein [Candidatus Methanoperedenaceae archaeon GB37]|nr:RadC-like JAB domain protein [Candidatus Methanoperedenaceae archaeon GB37]